MTTSKHSKPSLDPQISSPPAGPAKTSATPGPNAALLVSDQGSGQRLPERFATYDPDGLCWRTSQRCLLEGWAMLSENWPRSGMTRSGTAYQLPPLTRRTYATGSGSLPTPTTGKGGGSSRSGNRKDEVPTLEGMARKGLLANFPTPSATPYGTNQGGSMGRTGKVRPSLQTMAKKGMLGRVPTPTVGDGGEGRMWPTPAAHEARLGYQDRTTGKKGDQISLSTSVMNSEGRKPGQEWSGGQLNPAWVEWLMGFPVGWTDLERSETE